MHNRFVIYTVIVGGYDTIYQPAIMDEHFDYVLFSDTPIDNPGVWQVRQIPYATDKQWLKARYPRINVENVLSEYEASLYIDGNVQISSKYVYDRFIELFQQGVEWAGINHQGRDGLLNEINAIIGLGWVHDYEVIEWYQYLRKNHFPDQMGLYENNIIFRRHIENVAKVNQLWWWSLENYAVRRDQFSLMYALWKVPGIKCSLFLSANENAWNNNGLFVCREHKLHKRELYRSLWEKLRDRYVRMFYSSGGWEIYYTHWFDNLIKWPFPHLAMHVWTAYIMVRYDLKFLIKRVWRRF